MASMPLGWASGAAISFLEDTGAAGVARWDITGVGSSLAMEVWGRMAKRVAKDMLPASNWRVTAPGGQICRAALQMVRKDWQTHSSSSMASLSRSSILSL